MAHAPNSARSASAYALIGLAFNAGLVVVKIVAGVLGNSYALIADGVESITDLFGSLVVWRGVRVAERSPDDRYPFGYGKAESVAAAVVALLLLGAAGGIALRAFQEAAEPHGPPAAFTLVVLVVVIVLKESLFRRIGTEGESRDSPALLADAWHHRADAITSAAAFVGISIALVGGEAWSVADEYAAVVASGIIALNGVVILRGAVRELMDVSAPAEVLHRIRTRACAVPGVLGIEKVMSRRSGRGWRVVLHVEAAPDLSLRDAHDLGGRVRGELRSLPEVVDVVVHMEPWDGEPPGDEAAADDQWSSPS